MKPWKRLDDHTKIDKISHRVIVTKIFEMSDGNIEEFGTVWPEGQQFVATIALTKERQVVVARMFRSGPELVMDELPGGCVDEGETIEEAGARELLEETGYRAGHLELLGKSHKDAYMNAVWHFVLATDCAYEPDETHEQEVEEQIEVRLISIEELIANAKKDKMTDAVGVLIAYDTLCALKNPSGGSA